MEKYSRVLVIIFFLCILNMAFSIIIISKVSKTTEKPTTIITQLVKTPMPGATSTALPNSQPELLLIRAEIRALRESIESNGLLLATPLP